MDRTRQKIRDLDGKIKEAATRVTLEEVESYWKVLPDSIRELVSEEGEVVPDLLTYIADDDDERKEILRQHGCLECELKDKATVLEALQLISEETSRRLRRNRVAKRGAQRALDESLKVKMAKNREQAMQLQEGEVPTKRWLESCSGAIALPRRRRRADDAGIPPDVVEEVKEREHRKWELEAAQVVEILQANMDLPIVKGAEGSVRQDEYYKSVVGSYRSSTLRKRIREWRKYTRWLETVHRVRWLSKAFHVLDYFTDLRLTGAPHSVPQSFATTLSFFERAAAIPEEEMLSKDSAVRRGLDYTNKEMEESRPEKRQAPILPLRIIAAMELLVMNEDEPSFLRFACWAKLIKVWTSSRTDDLQGISLKAMKYGRAGLHGIFWRTKVSGPGKKNKVLPFMVSNRVSVTGEAWLKTGMSLLEEKYWYPRDYLMPTYPEGLEEVQERRPATYDDFVTLTRLVYSKLKECHFTGGAWTSKESPLMLPELCRFFTEHSERNFVVSVACSTHGGEGPVKDFIEEVKYDRYSVERQMQKLTMPETWTPLALDDTFLGMVNRPLGVDPEEMGTAAEDLPVFEGPPISEIMEERKSTAPDDGAGSEEDDIDMSAKFFIAINVRSKHRKLHIWGKCGTKPGENFSAYEPHDSLKGVEYNSMCGHCWKGRQPEDYEESSSTSSSSDMD
eukprot:s974_g4.t1